MPLYDYDEYPPDTLLETTDQALRTLQPHAHRFDSIAVRGVSGMIVGSPVALMLGKPLVVVRKGTESAHSSRSLCNMERAGRSYLFLDDFTCTGATHIAVMDEMQAHTQARHAGYYLYASDRLVLESQDS